VRALFFSRTFRIGAGIILFANVVALGGAAYNRSGAAESELQLSQRELGTTWTEAENSGLTLSLDVVNPEDPREDTNTASRGMLGMRAPYAPRSTPYWLDSTKLREIGYPLPARPVADTTHTTGRRGLEREALFVLELDGPVYHAALDHARLLAARADSASAAKPKDSTAAHDAESAARVAQRITTESSRLYLVDAGRDVATLRARYPDRTHYAIVWGRYTVWDGANKGSRNVYAFVQTLEANGVNVPRQFRDALLVLTRPGAKGSPLRAVNVTVAFGRRLEPWIVAASRPK
jgi:hypothetical protein